MPTSWVGIFHVLWLSNLLLLGDGAPERRPLSISSPSFLNFPKQNLFQFILVLEDVPPAEDEPAELQRENKQNMIGKWETDILELSQEVIWWRGSLKEHADDSHQFETDVD